jgi:hypothetical protein
MYNNNIAFQTLVFFILEKGRREERVASADQGVDVEREKVHRPPWETQDQRQTERIGQREQLAGAQRGKILSIMNLSPKNLLFGSLFKKIIATTYEIKSSNFIGY